MRKVRFTPAAKEQLKSIWQYAFETWGEQKADAYLAEIEAKLNVIAENPARERERPEIKPGYHSIKVNRHIIFCLLGKEHIDVIGILHERMDVAIWI
jgi:toxin ParE1/3/4